MKINESSQGIEIFLKVVPNSSKNEICGIYNEQLLKVKIAKAPEDGKANKECEKFFAKLLGIRKKDVSVVAGHTSVLKTLLLVGVTKEDISRLLS